jgi:hypothetical protein
MPTARTASACGAEAAISSSTRSSATSPSPFSVSGSNITIDFTPKGRDPLSGGKYTYVGDVAGATLSGKGTYKTKLKKKGGGVLTAKGPGNVKSPRGSFTAVGTERYTLTPATC